MLRIFWHLGLSLLLGALPVHASAQHAPSKQQLEAGNELLQSGKLAYREQRFADALYDFEQAYQRLQRPAILYLIGDTADKLGDHERAVSALRQYLDVQPQAQDREFIETRIRANLEALQLPRVGPQADALSPQAAARSSTNATAPTETPQPAGGQDASRGQDLSRAWWLWAGAGTLAVAGIVVAALLIGSSSTRAQPPVQGNVGGVVQTLGAP
jgi:tetratricopeptide (TPR) repeat protein